MPKKKKKEGKPEVHGELEGFEIRINEFGEIKTSFEVDKLNRFLNDNVEDKKLKEKREKEPEQENSEEEE